MRDLGVDEATIQKLREYDWNDFNSERRFYEKLQESDNQSRFVSEVFRIQMVRRNPQRRR